MAVISSKLILVLILRFESMRSLFDQNTRIFSLAAAIVFFVYTNIKAAKDSIFLAFVGQKSVPIAKLGLIVAALLFLLPLYPRLLKCFGKKRLLLATASFYSVFCFSGALAIKFLGTESASGLENFKVIFGWFFYTIADLFSFFVLQTFWSTVSSMVSPEWSSKNYWIPTAFGQLVGIGASVFGLFITAVFSGPNAFSLLLTFSSIALFGLVFVAKNFFKILPDQESSDTKNEINLKLSISQMLKTIFTNWYLLATLGLVFSFYVVASISEFQLHCALARESGGFAKEILKKLFIYTALLQTVGVIAAISVTKALPRFFGLGKTLLLCPILGCALAGGVLINPTVLTALSVHVFQKGLYYGFLDPVFQMLFVPMSVEIQFIAKNWVVAFGAILSKGAGALLNLFASRFAKSQIIVLLVAIGFTFLIWLICAIFVARGYKRVLVMPASRSRLKNSKETEII